MCVFLDFIFPYFFGANLYPAQAQNTLNIKYMTVNSIH